MVENLEEINRRTTTKLWSSSRVLRHSKEEDEKTKEADIIIEETSPKKKVRQMWPSEHDVFILTHTIEESILALGRTESSIETRLKRLKNNTARVFKDKSKPGVITG